MMLPRSWRPGLTRGPNAALPLAHTGCLDRLPSAADARLRTASREPVLPTAEPPRRAGAPPRAGPRRHQPEVGGRRARWRHMDDARDGPGADERAGRARGGGRRRSARRGPRRWPPGPAWSRPASACPGCTTPRPARPASSSTSRVRWAGRPVAGPVAARLGVPVFLINDARAFGLAELRLGAGRGAGSMVGLTLGTGVGGVIAVDGRVHQGHDGTAGELGHQTIDPDGPPCGCGNHGCLEAFARADRIAAACGTATAEEAVARARAGDPAGARGAGPDRPLPGHRHREHDRRAVAGSGRHRRRRCRGGRPAVHADPRRACGAGPDDVARRRRAGRRRSSGSGPARSGRRSTARSGRPAGRRRRSPS